MRLYNKQSVFFSLERRLFLKAGASAPFLGSSLSCFLDSDASAAVTREESANLVLDFNSTRQSTPPTFFGFNIEHFEFEDEFMTRGQLPGVRPDFVQAMKVFPGALYRYPGGLVANRFDWRASVGPYVNRPPRKSVAWAQARRIGFGVDEYLDFVRQVSGHPWFVLNLVGWHEREMVNELPSNDIAAHNQALAKYVLERWNFGSMPRYYQLGNELDRSIYEWPIDKYIQRCRDTIVAMLQADPEARFVLFLRDFDWRYKSRFGKNKMEDFVRDALSGLPMVNDFSLHMYYDQSADEDSGRTDIQWRLERFRKTVAVAAGIRGGRSPNLWITEHARALSPHQRTANVRHLNTSGLSGAISSADFLISATSIPELKGACWHALGGVYWKLLEQNGGQLRPTPVYTALRMLHDVQPRTPLTVGVRGGNFSDYAGGYDINAAAFITGSGRQQEMLGLWLVNRADRQYALDLSVPHWRSRNLGGRHEYLAGPAGMDADAVLSPEIGQQSVQGLRVDANGLLRLTLRPNSVSIFQLQPT